MKNKLLVLLSVIFFSSCDRANNVPDCSFVDCAYVTHSLKIKYVDKETGELLIAPGSSYTLSDFKVTRETNSTYLPEVSSHADAGVVVLTPLIAGQTLTLGSLPADKITMQTKVRGKGCCDGFDIISVKVNGETVCAPCNDLDSTIAVIEK